MCAGLNSAGPPCILDAGGGWCMGVFGLGVLAGRGGKKRGLGGRERVKTLVKPAEGSCVNRPPRDWETGWLLGSCCKNRVNVPGDKQSLPGGLYPLYVHIFILQDSLSLPLRSLPPPRPPQVGCIFHLPVALSLPCSYFCHNTSRTGCELFVFRGAFPLVLPLAPFDPSC